MSRTAILSRVVVALGMVATGVAANQLSSTHGSATSAVMFLYVVGGGASLLALARHREFGLFLGGAFAVNCGLGCLMSVGQLVFFGHQGLAYAAAGLMLGALGTCLACLPSAMVGDRPEWKRWPSA